MLVSRRKGAGGQETSGNILCPHVAKVSLSVCLSLSLSLFLSLREQLLSCLCSFSINKCHTFFRMLSCFISHQGLSIHCAQDLS